MVLVVRTAISIVKIKKNTELSIKHITKAESMRV